MVMFLCQILTSAASPIILDDLWLHSLALEPMLGDFMASIVVLWCLPRLTY